MSLQVSSCGFSTNTVARVAFFERKQHFAILIARFLIFSALPQIVQSIGAGVPMLVTFVEHERSNRHLLGNAAWIHMTAFHSEGLSLELP